MVSTRLRVSRRPTHYLCPVGSEPVNVLGVLPGMGEGVVQFRVRQTPSVVGSGQGHKSRVATGELEQGGSHSESFAPRID